MIGLYRKITHDLFGIARRLKSIDCDYFVVYSYRDKRYEVHNKGNKGSTYCFCADRLDERIIDRARRTRRERIAELIASMERDNERLLKREAEQTTKRIASQAEHVLSKGGL